MNVIRIDLEGINHFILLLMGQINKSNKSPKLAKHAMFWKSLAQMKELSLTSPSLFPDWNEMVLSLDIAFFAALNNCFYKQNE